jgi:tripartite-type tricarboxylate transporter receptor subunit TctC
LDRPPLAQSGKTRTSTLAKVPAIAESYPGFEAYAWWGVFAPAGTLKAIISRFASKKVTAFFASRTGASASTTFSTIRSFASSSRASVVEVCP